jgi:hypothetical protein
VARLLANQLLAGPQQRAQFLYCRLRNETRADQAIGQQIGDPGGIVDVGPGTFLM